MPAFWINSDPASALGAVLTEYNYFIMSEPSQAKLLAAIIESFASHGATSLGFAWVIF